MLHVFTATHSLVLAAANLTAGATNYTWSSASAACIFGISPSDDSFTTIGGLGRDDVTLEYDEGLFSFVGCRCMIGYDNVYRFDATGEPATVDLANVRAYFSSMCCCSVSEDKLTSLAHDRLQHTSSHTLSFPVSLDVAGICTKFPCCWHLNDFPHAAGIYVTFPCCISPMATALCCHPAANLLRTRTTVQLSAACCCQTKQI